jgi:uncharacterized protein (DUF1778 family)
MANPRRRRSSADRPSVRSVRVRIDDESKRWLEQAARLRGISLSDYVRAVAVPQARRELLAAREQRLALTPEERLAFWRALAEPPTLTEAHRCLGMIMQGGS